MSDDTKKPLNIEAFREAVNDALELGELAHTDDFLAILKDTPRLINEVETLRARIKDMGAPLHELEVVRAERDALRAKLDEAEAAVAKAAQIIEILRSKPLVMR